jgi:hypothetical protein
MTSTDWHQVIRLQWENIKKQLTTLHQLEFEETQRAFNIQLLKPTGFKAGKLAEPEVIKKPKDEKAVPNKNKKANPKDKKEAIKDKKQVKKGDGEHQFCIADILQHYGSAQRLTCQVPCKYLHYKEIPAGVTKTAIITCFENLQKRFELTDATIAFITKKVNVDKKFK